jgi:hypothetical protein
MKPIINKDTTVYSGLSKTYYTSYTLTVSTQTPDITRYLQKIKSAHASAKIQRETSTIPEHDIPRRLMYNKLHIWINPAL